MGVAGGRLDVTVAEQLPDYRQGLAERQGPGRKGMSEIVNSYIFQPGALADAPPGSLQIGEVGARQGAKGRRPGTAD